MTQHKSTDLLFHQPHTTFISSKAMQPSSKFFALARLGRLIAIAHFIVGRIWFLLCILKLTLEIATPWPWRPHDLEQRSIWAQRYMQRFSQTFLDMLYRIRLIRVRWIGRERLLSTEPLLIVANHPSFLDVFFLLAELPQADCLVSQKWARNPTLSAVIKATEWVTNDSSRQMLETCIARLQAGRTLVLFPEGTRSPEGELNEFQRGAAHIALHAKCPILPVVIHCKNPKQMRELNWSTPYEEPGEFVLEVLNPVSPADYLDKNQSPAVNARKLTATLFDIFSKRLASAEF